MLRELTAFFGTFNSGACMLKNNLCPAVGCTVSSHCALHCVCSSEILLTYELYYGATGCMCLQILKKGNMRSKTSSAACSWKRSKLISSTAESVNHASVSDRPNIQAFRFTILCKATVFTECDTDGVFILAHS